MKEFKSVAWMVKNQLPVSQDPPQDEESQRALRAYWRQNAGIAAPYTYPLLFQSGRLVLFCDSAAWGTRIRYQIPSLLRQLNESGFGIREIKTRIRPLSAVRTTASKYRKTINPISPENASAIGHLAKKVQHQGLKESLLRLSKRAVRK